MMPKDKQPPKAMQPPRSAAFNDAENERVFKYVMQPDVQPLSIGVAQLLLSQNNNRAEWQLCASGVVAFLKDWKHRSFFIRAYETHTGSPLWEQDISTLNSEISMEDADCCCHFQNQDSYVWLLFSQEADYRHFKDVALQKLSRMLKKRSEKVALSSHVPQSSSSQELSEKVQPDKKPSSEPRLQRKPLPSKLDISAPLPGSFRVDCHIGIDSRLDLMQLGDPEFLRLLKLHLNGQKQPLIEQCLKQSDETAGGRRRFQSIPNEQHHPVNLLTAPNVAPPKPPRGEKSATTSSLPKDLPAAIAREPGAFSYLVSNPVYMQLNGSEAVTRKAQQTTPLKGGVSPRSSPPVLRKPMAPTTNRSPNPPPLPPRPRALSGGKERFSLYANTSATGRNFQNQTQLPQ